MSKCQILNGRNKKALKEYLVKENQFLLPLVESIERDILKKAMAIFSRAQ